MPRKSLGLGLSSEGIHPNRETPLDILKRQLAEGKITPAEFEERRRLKKNAAAIRKIPIVLDKAREFSPHETRNRTLNSKPLLIGCKGL